MATDVNLIVAQVVNFQLYKGDSWAVQLLFTDSANQPIDLSQVTLKIQLKNQSGVIVQTFETGDGITVSGPDHNVVSIVKNIMGNEKGSYKYDLQATYTDGSIVTYLRGTLNVTEDVTQ